MKKIVLIGLLILITFFALALSNKPKEEKENRINDSDKHEQILKKKENSNIDENELEIISLNNFLNDYFPEYRTNKTIDLNGKCLGYSVANDTGEIIIATEENSICNVYFLAANGEQIWQKSFDSSYTKGRILNYTPVEISDDGSAIVIHKGIYERVINLVYDHSGNLLFEKPADNQYWYRLIPTPDGKYFYEKQSAIECRINGFYMYDKTGEEIEITGYDFSEEKWIRPVFINENKVVMYMEDKICFFNFNSGHFNLISEFDLDKMHSFREYFQEDVLFSEKYVIISNQNSLEAQAFLFNNDGEFVREFIPYDTAVMINPDMILVRLNHSNQKYMKIININENKILHDNPIKFREYYKQCIELNEVLLVSRIFWEAQDNRISSFIFDEESMQKVSGIEEIAICTDENCIFLTIKDDNCSVIIGGSKNED